MLEFYNSDESYSRVGEDTRLTVEEQLKEMWTTNITPLRYCGIVGMNKVDYNSYLAQDGYDFQTLFVPFAIRTMKFGELHNTYSIDAYRLQYVFPDTYELNCNNIDILFHKIPRIIYGFFKGTILLYISAVDRNKSKYPFLDILVSNGTNNTRTGRLSNSIESRLDSANYAISTYLEEGTILKSTDNTIMARGNYYKYRNFEYQPKKPKLKNKKYVSDPKKLRTVSDISKNSIHIIQF